VSVVYKAICAATNRTVIVKAYKTHKMNAKQIHKAKREIALMQDLRYGRRGDGSGSAAPMISDTVVGGTDCPSSAVKFYISNFKLIIRFIRLLSFFMHGSSTAVAHRFPGGVTILALCAESKE
jgi:serine/threonine protein kinase